MGRKRLRIVLPVDKKTQQNEAIGTNLIELLHRVSKQDDLHTN